MEVIRLNRHYLPVSTIRKNVVRGSFALICLLLAGYGAKILYQTRPRQMVATLLRLESTPASFQHAECTSWGVTDALTTCAFEIDPAEFPALLKGWKFARSRTIGGSHTFSGGPKAGPEFAVAEEFVINDPPSFPNGGRVILVTDAHRSKAQVDFYEE